MPSFLAFAQDLPVMKMIQLFVFVTGLGSQALAQVTQMQRNERAKQEEIIRLQQKQQQYLSQLQGQDLFKQERQIHLNQQQQAPVQLLDRQQLQSSHFDIRGNLIPLSEIAYPNAPRVQPDLFYGSAVNSRVSQPINSNSNTVGPASWNEIWPSPLSQSEIKKEHVSAVLNFVVNGPSHQVLPDFDVLSVLHTIAKYPELFSAAIEKNVVIPHVMNGIKKLNTANDLQATGSDEENYAASADQKTFVEYLWLQSVYDYVKTKENSTTADNVRLAALHFLVTEYPKALQNNLLAQSTEANIKTALWTLVKSDQDMAEFLEPHTGAGVLKGVLNLDPLFIALQSYLVYQDEIMTADERAQLIQFSTTIVTNYRKNLECIIDNVTDGKLLEDCASEFTDFVPHNRPLVAKGLKILKSLRASSVLNIPASIRSLWLGMTNGRMINILAKYFGKKSLDPANEFSVKGLRELRGYTAAELAEALTAPYANTCKTLLGSPASLRKGE